MITFSIWRKRSFRKALGVLTLSTAMLAGSVSSGTLLQATQEEAPASAVELKVPDDLSDETLEGIDAALAKSLGPKLAVLFDSGQSAEARHAAAVEISAIASGIPATTPITSNLQRRLLRRVALLSAAVQASQVSDLAVNPDSHTAKLSDAVGKVQFPSLNLSHLAD